MAFASARCAIKQTVWKNSFWILLLMTAKRQVIALYTLVRRELVRMFRIASQTFLPPVITTALYFLIFGHLIGDRIGSVAGLPYTAFIAPGLIMMAVITN